MDDDTLELCTSVRPGILVCCIVGKMRTSCSLEVFRAKIMSIDSNMLTVFCEVFITGMATQYSTATGLLSIFREL